MELYIELCGPWVETDEPDRPPEGITVSENVEIREDLSLVENIVLGLFLIVAGIPATVASLWIYDYLRKHGTARIRIDEEEILMDDREEVVRIVRRKIEVGE